MREDIEIFYAIFVGPDGTTVVRGVGVGADGSLWVEAPPGPDQAWLKKLQRDVGAVVLRDPDDGRVYVEARAMIAACESPELEKELVAGVEAWLEHLHPSNFRG